MKQTTYYGNPISAYGLEHGVVDYACLAQSFQHVLCNNIPDIDPSICDNVVSGMRCKYINEDTDEELTAEEYDALSEEEQNGYVEYLDMPEIFQYYIVGNNAEDILAEAGEIVFYSEKLDCYIWGVTHYGTSWDYVLTDIKINTEEDDK